jgi:hypothetical protein
MENGFLQKQCLGMNTEIIKYIKVKEEKLQKTHIARFLKNFFYRETDIKLMKQNII